MAFKKEYDPLTKETILSTTAPSGLRVRAIQKEGLTQTCALLAIDFGSTHNAYVPAGKSRAVKLPSGLAHFLEHKMFEKPTGDLFERFSADGAHANAMTGHTMTGYYFVATDRAEDHLDTLLEVCFAPHFTDALVEKEFGIIDQEIRGYDDSPAWRAWRMLLENLYWKHPARLDIAGTSETIREIDAKVLYGAHSAFYVPRNMVLTIAGKVDLEAAMARIEQRLGRKKVGPPKAEVRRVEEPDRIKRKLSRVEMEVAMPRLLLGFKGPGGVLPPKEALLNDAAATMFLECVLGEVGTLHQELYHEGLIADDFGYSATIEEDFSYGWMGGTTPDPKRLARRLSDALAEALDHRLDPEVLEAVKRRQIGDAVRMYDQPESLAWSLAEGCLRNQSLAAWPKLLQGMSEGTLRKRARTFFAADRAARVEVWPKGQTPSGRG